MPQSLRGHCPGTEGRVHPVHSSCSQLSPRAAGLGAQGLRASGRGCHVPRPRSSCAECPQTSRVGTRSLASDGFCYSDLVTRSVAHSPEWPDSGEDRDLAIGHSFIRPASVGLGTGQVTRRPSLEENSWKTEAGSWPLLAQHSQEASQRRDIWGHRRDKQPKWWAQHRQGINPEQTQVYENEVPKDCSGRGLGRELATKWGLCVA